MKCKKCGSDVPSDSKFCSACGDNLQNQNVSDSETTQEKDTLNKQNENDYNQSPKEVNNINEQPKNKNIFKIVISVCLVVITIVVIISAIGVNSGMSEEISTVKNGHFFDYPEEDGYTTIGTAFENYFDNTKWYYFVSDLMLWSLKGHFHIMIKTQVAVYNLNYMMIITLRHMH